MSYSFKKGFMQVRQMDVGTVKEEIMTALEIKSRRSWSLRLNGEIEPKVSEARAIEEIFAKYGVTEIWD